MAGRFIASLVNSEGGKMIETSRALTEDELRDLLAKSYGESEAEIRARIQRANADPEF
jgi:hypothetical protein